MANYVQKHPRSSSLYYVRTVPADTRAKIGQAKWKISLGTSSRTMAAPKARALAVEHDAMIAAARAPAPIATLPPETRARIEAAGGVTAYLTTLEEAAREATNKLDNIRFLEAAGQPPVPEASTDVWSQAAVEMVQENESRIGEKGRPFNGADLHDTARDLVHIAELDAGRKALESNVNREAPTVRHLATAPDKPLEAHPALTTALTSSPPDLRDNHAITLSGVLAAWERAKRPQAPEQYRYPVRLFEELHGELLVSAITKAHVREFRDAIETVPTARPRAADHNPSLADLQRRAKAGATPIARATARKYLRAVGTILRFAVTEGYIDDSPADSIHFHRGREKFSEAQGARRRSLTPAEVRALLTAINDRLPPSKADTAWFIRLALYSGLRGEEAAQIAPDDVRDYQGTPYIRIHDEGDNKLKNRSSLRLLPIHPVLIKTGFLKFVEKRRSAKFLFTSLKADARGRRYSQMQRRIVAVLRTGANIRDDRVVPHSFRHTFKDSLRLTGVPDEVADRLLGHTSPKRAVQAGYGNPDQIAVLAEWMAKVDPLDARRHVFAFDEANEARAAE